MTFVCELWPVVNMHLIESVRRGNKPAIPSNALSFILSLIQDCWNHDSLSCPSALSVSQDFLDSFTPQVLAAGTTNPIPHFNGHQSGASSAVVHQPIADSDVCTSTAVLNTTTSVLDLNFSMSPEDSRSPLCSGTAFSINSNHENLNGAGLDNHVAFSDTLENY